MAHEESFDMIDPPDSGKPRLIIPEQMDIMETESDLSASQHEVVYIQGFRFWLISIA